jgi:hypothetical protein
MTRSREVAVIGIARACRRSQGSSRRPAGTAWVVSNTGLEQR